MSTNKTERGRNLKGMPETDLLSHLWDLICHLSFCPTTCGLSSTGDTSGMMFLDPFMGWGVVGGQLLVLHMLVLFDSLPVEHRRLP